MHRAENYRLCRFAATTTLHFDEVTREGVEYVLTRSDQPQAVLIPYNEFAEFVEWREREIMQEFDRAIVRLAEQNAKYSEEEIAADVEAAIQEVRSERM